LVHVHQLLACQGVVGQGPIRQGLLSDGHQTAP
jgi:hypothetical protein